MNIAIGKYTLESLTSGMYNTPMVIYREYIQNAIDAIDDAIDHGILNKKDVRVTIEIDSNLHRVVIEDNGSGISAEEVENQLLGIGNSNKALLKRRGFRGIGRLVGIGYADQLSFHTTFKGESIGTTISIDCKKLREILVPGQYEEFGMVDALEHVIQRVEYSEEPDLHYFRVVLDDVGGNEQVLDYSIVHDYLCQTAPLPYGPSFSWGPQIEKACIDAGHPLANYAIYLKHSDSEEEQLFKLYSDRFFVNMSKQQVDQLNDVKICPIMNNGYLVALLWYGQCSYLGTILDNKIKGLRFRKGNMLVGDRSTNNGLFKEERFNGWFQGEIFVFDESIIPNSRRDDFENNHSYYSLLSELSTIGAELSREIRQASSNRNADSSIYDKIRMISNQSSASITMYPEINRCSVLSQSNKKLLETVFQVIDEVNPPKSAQIKREIINKIRAFNNLN